MFWILTMPLLSQPILDTIASCTAEALPNALAAAGRFDANVVPRTVADERELETLVASLVADRATKGIVLALPATNALVASIRRERKDIYLAIVRVSLNERPALMYGRGLLAQKRLGINLVLAHDVGTGHTLVIGPEQSRYHEGEDLAATTNGFAEMIALRSGLTFTRSTVVDGAPVEWSDPLVPASLRIAVDHCIAAGAYKPVNGTTVGHFAVKVGDGEFLTSRRKTNFNELNRVGLVRVRATGDDEVIAYGSRPSVGGQSQRIVFREHPDADCILHFHSPLRAGSEVPVREQRPYECGSHECGKNTSAGLRNFGGIHAVMLEGHGPNVVFNRATNPERVIRFVEDNFDLAGRTDGEVEFPAEWAV